MNENVMLLYKIADTLFAKLAEARSEIASLENHIDEMRLHADDLAYQRDEQRDKANRLEEEIRARRERDSYRVRKESDEYCRDFFNLSNNKWPTRKEDE